MWTLWNYLLLKLKLSNIGMTHLQKNPQRQNKKSLPKTFQTRCPWSEFFKNERSRTLTALHAGQVPEQLLPLWSVQLYNRSIPHNTPLFSTLPTIFSITYLLFTQSTNFFTFLINGFLFSQGQDSPELLKTHFVDFAYPANLMGIPLPMPSVVAYFQICRLAPI